MAASSTLSLLRAWLLGITLRAGLLRALLRVALRTRSLRISAALLRWSWTSLLLRAWLLRTLLICTTTLRLRMTWPLLIGSWI